VIVVALLAGAATVSSASAANVPVAALSAMTQVAQNDVAAQVISDPGNSASASVSAYLSAANTNPASISATATGAVAARTLIAADESTAQYTATVGHFRWDSGVAVVSNPTVVSQTASTLEVQVTVTETFHIAGTPADSAPADISAEVNPYLFTFALAGNGAWDLAGVSEIDPDGVPNATSSGNTPSPSDASQSALATQTANAAAVVASHASNRLRGYPLTTPVPANPRIVRPHARAEIASSNYNRGAAFNYAWTWWNSHNPAYPYYRDDCQNFASQVIHAGGVTQSIWDTWNPGGYEWINVFGFEWWVNNAGGPLEYLSYVSSLDQGDVLHIHYPNGSGHAMEVLSQNGGNPLLAGHTNNDWNMAFTTVESKSPGATYYAMHVIGTGRK
jgi:hypothetical protein